MNKLTSLFLVLCFIFYPVLAHAQELKGTVTPMNKGSVAPYVGVLLDAEAWASIMVEKRLFSESRDLVISFEVAKTSLQLQQEIDKLQIHIDTDKTMNDALKTLKDNQIKDLTIKLAKIQTKTNYDLLWLTGGIVLGVGMSIGIFYAVK